MKTPKQHLIAIVLTLFFGLCSIQASAVSFTVRTGDYSRGNVKYKLKGAASYTGPGSSFNVNANVGDSVLIVATSTSVYGFSYWDFDMANPPMAGTNNYGYWIAVTEAYNGKTVTAQFNSWSPTNIVNGATYTLAPSGSGTDFTVTSDEDTRFNGKVFSSIGRVEYSIDGGTTTIEFNTSQPVWVMERIHIMKGFLTLKLGDDYTATANHPSLLRHERNTISSLIIVDPPTSMTVPSACRLAIQGKSSANFVIHGNCGDMAVDSTNIDYIHLTKGSTGVETGYGLMDISGGKVDMEWVTFTHSWRNGNKAAGINVVAAKYLNCPAEVTLEHSIVEWCRNLGFGSGIGFDFKVRNSSFEMTDCEVRYCNTDNNGGGMEGPGSGCGGAIRSMGGNLCALSLTDCELHHNYTPGHGGAIRWHSALIDPLELTNCTFRNNWAGCWGGAMRVESGVIFSDCTIKDNRASVAGGGISYGTFTGGSVEYIENAGVYNPTDPQYGWYPVDGIMALDADTEIKNNTAGSNGGAIHIFANFISFCNVYLNNNGTPYKMGLTMDGTSIEDNTAGENGGAVYMSRDTEYYGIDVNLNKGTIDNNTATAGNGGSFCITEEITVPYDPSSGHSYQPIRAFIGTDDTSVTGDLVMTNNTAVNGGGISVQNGSVTIYDNAVVGQENNANTCTGGNGGGVYVNGGDLTMYGGALSFNKANSFEDNGGSGGGFYVEGGQVEMKGGTITKNEADHCGGAFYVKVSDDAIVTKINSSASASTISLNVAGDKGGGVYVEKGTLQIEDAATNITADTAYVDGGGIYMAGGTVTVTNAKLQGNVARDGFGGGMYLGANSSNSITVSGSEAAIKGNRAFNQGGGVYVGGGTFTMTGGAIGGALADGNFTTSADSYGGGLYMNGGTATISNCSISGNYTCSRDPDDLSGCGGAVYMNGGSCLLKGGSAIGGVPELNDPDDPDDDLYYTNVSKYGGGIYSANGTITVKGGAIGYNSAEKGGGIYSNGSKAKVYVQKDSSKADVLSYIEHNTAEYGGGIYGEKGRVEFSDGYIQYNTASQQGGGIYVDANDTLYLKGSANLVLNGVPTNHKGGGVYLVGSIIVGEVASPLGTIMVRSNYAYTTTQPDTLLTSGGEVADSLRNNVYLPNPVVHEYGESTHAGVIEVVENGISNLSHVGFSVPHGNVPVIYCTRSSSSWGYLHQFSTGQPLQHNLFDDSGRYRSVQYSNDPTFNPDHVYLYGFWSDEVTGEGDDYCEVDMDDFVGKDTIYIYLPCQLAFFISWVNGREAPTHIDPHSTVCAKLMDDIDMSEFGWVPIGTETRPYSGVFDGNGHTVTGIRSLLNDYHTNYGFFGKLADNAVVKNLFLNEASFHIEKKSGYGGKMYIGGVAGLTSGNATIENCESASTIFVEPDNTNTVMGGLVGKMESGTIHSSIAIPDMTGFQMGGLVGQNGDSILNSFANAKFTKAVSDHTQYMGGLVGVNTGHVENCYSLVRGTAPATTYFGYLAGNNDGGTLKYSYAHQNIYVSTEGTTGTQTGIGTYGVTQLPYLYKHRDTQVDANNDYVPTGTDADKQLMFVLNRWVDTINSKQSAINYTKWGRPWQESDAQKPLNDDYPILKMPMTEAVAAKAGDPYLYYNPVDSLLVRCTDAESAIWVYRNPSDTVRGDNSTSAAKLYIAEDVVLLNDNALKAYVGITLDNSAGAGGAYPTYFPGVPDVTDWHMIATPLSDAPIGINYTDGDAYDFDYSHPSGMPYYLFYPKDDAKHGYFPSHRFGKDYPSSDHTIEPGNYYTEWDFYSYSEPDYHWINFKRNSASHHHMEAEDHSSIDYYGDGVNLGNETRLVPGKGYFAATREETFLQCQGHLNNGAVAYNLTQTSGVPRHGYNLIGNPYQAYLNFDAFADANSGVGDNKIWTVAQNASYTILDEDELETSTNMETVMGVKPVFYRTYSYGCSSNPDVSAGGFIHPHQGFFVRLEGDKASAQAQFAPDQRNATAKSKFRGNDHIDYPLVNLFAIEGNGAADVVTVELGRPDQGGAPLMQSLRVGNGKIWCHYNDKDYAIAYTQPGITEVGIRFETVEDTEYTMRWSTRNGDFSYLHLIDNKTGADVDCLTTDEYKFSASMSDYKSRFRLVFGYTGIEEESEAEANENFAFIMNDALVVTGEGVLQVFDMTGRMVASQELHGVQTTVSLPAAANGVYVLRLTNGRQSQVQKMVISK